MVVRRLLAALFVALFGSAIFTFWLSKKVSKPQAGVSAHQHYVATAQNLDAGQTLMPANMKLIDWPASAPLEGAFAKPEDISGRNLLYPLSAGQPILERQLSAPGTGSGLSTRIPDGMRAISLKSDQVVGVAGFLLPGTHVDVLVTYRSLNSLVPVTSMVLQDVQILAAGQKTTPDPEGKASTTDVVTLLVKPMDAEKALMANAEGTVHFVLRNGSDHEHVSEEPIQFARMASAAPPSVVRSTIFKSLAPAVSKPYTVMTIAGQKQTSESFQ